jgi:hypothetical protein
MSVSPGIRHQEEQLLEEQRKLLAEQKALLYLLLGGQ